MKLYVAIICFLILAATNSWAANNPAEEINSLINIINDSQKSDKDRESAEDQLIEMEAMEVLPILAKQLPNMPMEGIWNSGGRIIDRSAPFEWQRYYALYRIWENHLSGPASEEKGRFLLTLAKNDSSFIHKPGVLAQIVSHKTQETELFLSKLAEDKTLEASTRMHIITLLLSDNTNKYFSYGLDIIEQSELPNKSSLFSGLLNMSDSLKAKLSQENKNRVVEFGCNLIKGNPTKDEYFTARDIGRYVNAPNDFAPDQELPEYRGENSLKDKFFSDTVHNAISWCEQNTK